MERDAVFFSVYTNVQLGDITADRRGVSVTLTFDTPPGNGRKKSPQERVAHWKKVGQKRLNTGGFIALVWDKSEVHLGLITSRTDDLLDSAKASETRLSIRVSFFGSEIPRRTLEKLISKSKNKKENDTPHFFVEIQILFESSRPFLEALKVEPTTVAFSRYLVQHPDQALVDTRVDPPEYSLKHGFSWDLSYLFDPPLPQTVKMRPDDSQSIFVAENYLKNSRSSRLDPSQAEAILSVLTREVGLIQGPPGTGKVMQQFYSYSIQSNIFIWITELYCRSTASCAHRQQHWQDFNDCFYQSRSRSPTRISIECKYHTESCSPGFTVSIGETSIDDPG
jgi:hypothetical protein